MDSLLDTLLPRVNHQGGNIFPRQVSEDIQPNELPFLRGGQFGSGALLDFMVPSLLWFFDLHRFASAGHSW